MKEKKNDRKRLRLVDFNRNGKGISKKKADLGFGLKRFFVSYKENFTKILYVNIFMVIGNFPLIFLVAALSGFTQSDAYVPMSDLFQNLGAMFATQTPSASGMVLYGLEGIQNQILVPTVATFIFYGISALTFFTFGLVNVGTAYVLRNIAKGEPVFVWSDFWYAVKKNWKQAFPFGIIDLLICIILVFNIYSMFMSISATGTVFTEILTSFMFWANIVILILYFFMRFYIYIQMVTFKLSVFKIIKNSLIFALLGFKRNIMAFLGHVAVILIELLCIFFFGGFLVPFAVAIPLVAMFSTMAYMKVFAAYYKMKAVMIDPYVKDEPETEFDEDDVIMKDDITEQERLEEIKKRNGIA